MSENERIVLRKKVKPSQSLRIKRQQPLQRHNSLGAIEELIQCGICLEKLKDPRMLPCQHTFCLTCLQSHLSANLLLFKQKADNATTIKCPICQNKVDLAKGLESLKELPKNLYVESVRKLVEEDISPAIPKSDSCIKCNIVSNTEQSCCQHCMQVFCNVCWQEHLLELEKNLSVLTKQVDESKVKLDCKLESFQNRCNNLVDKIKQTTRQKIDLLKMDEEKVLKDLEAIVSEGNINYSKINENVKELQAKLAKNLFDSNESGKVFLFMSAHREASRLISSVQHFGEARVIFDPEYFRLDQASEGVYSDIEENSSPATNSFERFDFASQHQYKNRSFVPKLVWNKCPRPSNIAVCPWDFNLLYIAATDTHSVLILNRDRRKLGGRLASSEMLFPQAVAFSEIHEEIYVSDKWKHCIHVFSKNGDYLRSMLGKGNGDGKVRSPDGLAVGPQEELVICDSGNDRIVVINSQTGEHMHTIGIVDNKTMLNMPTGVAVNGDKIIVADTGNHRIKIFEMTGKKVHEFGSLGKDKGQFRSAEVVAVDPFGFILVGDGGNARVQVFRPDGKVVKIFGGTNGFRWISGICVTPEFDVVVADSKSRCLKIF